MTLNEVLKRTDEDEELWFVLTDKLHLDEPWGWLFRRDQVCATESIGNCVTASRQVEPLTPGGIKSWGDLDVWSLVRVRNGRWERVRMTNRT